MSKLKMSAIGYLGNDCAIRYVNGVNAINFSVAVSEKYKDKAGVQHERTSWVECTLWRKPEQGRIAEFLKKGTLVAVEGRPEARGYKGKNGDAIYGSLMMRVDELHLLSKANAGNGVPPEQVTEPENTDQPKDDLPF